MALQPGAEITVEIIATGPRGPRGYTGTSAYEQAVAGGYTGTEAQFNQDLARFGPWAAAAGEAADTAATQAGYAANSASAASSSASSASGSASTASAKALVAEGFAVGEQSGLPVSSGSDYYENNAKYYKEEAGSSASAASGSASAASTNALKAEGFAVGQQNGTDVSSGSAYYHANAKYYKEEAGASASAASGSASDASTNALKSEGFAVGQQDGTDVSSGSTYYENNAKYMKEQAASYALQADSFSGESAAWATGNYSGGSTQNVPSSSSQYNNNSKYYATQASSSASSASGSASTASAKALVAEGFAVGEQNGTAVASGSDYYQNNAEYYAGQAAASATAAAASAASLTVDSALSDSSTNPVQNKVITAALETKAEIDGCYESMTVGNAEQLIATVGVEDKVPYLFRTAGGSADIGDRETDMVVGGTVAWNQLVDAGDTSVAVPAGHKYYADISGVKTIGASTGTDLSVSGGTDTVIDLTQMLGPAVADYLYTLETNAAGAGVAWFKKLFPKDCYAYNAGTLLSVNTAAHKTVGFNAYDHSTGKAKVVGGQAYQITGAYTALSLDGAAVVPDGSGYFTPAASGEITVTGGSDSTTCIHLKWDGERDGEYEAYAEHVYPLDSDLELRGVPRLDADNKLYYDGDTYASDGTVTRKYGIVTIDEDTTIRQQTTGSTRFYIEKNDMVRSSSYIGHMICSILPTRSSYGGDPNTEAYVSGYPNNSNYPGKNWLYFSDGSSNTMEAVKTWLASHPLTILYELINPAAESADPYQEPQVVDDFGTEEYLDAAYAAGTRDVAVPVGHVTRYQANLRAKLEMAPNSPSGDGDYIVRQTDGANAYVPLVFPVDELPEPPSSDGTYTLTVTVADGTATYSWEERT